jgi:hypothetical protein
MQLARMLLDAEISGTYVVVELLQEYVVVCSNSTYSDNRTN